MVPVGGSDVGMTVQAQEADGETAQRRRHNARCVPSPDQGLVFLVGHVADPCLPDQITLTMGCADKGRTRTWDATGKCRLGPPILQFSPEARTPPTRCQRLPQAGTTSTAV